MTFGLFFGIVIVYMARNLPSIDDLIAKKTSPTFKSAKKTLSSSTDDPQGVFNAKIETMEARRLEEKAMRLAQSLGLPYIDLQGFPIDTEALALIEESEARRLMMLCFYLDSQSIKIAVLDPHSEEVAQKIDELKKRIHINPQLFITSQAGLRRVFVLFKKVPKNIHSTGTVHITEDELNKFSFVVRNLKDVEQSIVTASTTDQITIILAGGLKTDASDVHIEAEEKGIVVRYRIDGVLHDVATIPKQDWLHIISRLKLLAKMKMNITSKPQDGHITINTKKDVIELRVSTLPTTYGESVVMRILRPSQILNNTLENLGLRKSAFEILQQQITRPNGMIITTGPTGSGKTTTLYAVLMKLNNPETKIITLEDPIEYTLEGVNQSQVDSSKQYTFASGLRSLLRQDPDIVMVGEIRDQETAETSINAALTGHLVISTLHTNDAAGAIPRFLAMGVKSFLLGPALNAIIGQRLVRKLCQKCKTVFALDDQTEKRVDAILEELPESEKKVVSDKRIFYIARGCDACQGMGYKGRIGVYEIFVMSDEIEKAINATQVSEYQMRDMAKKQGMVTMAQDGVLKALDGITSVEEVLRVTE